MKQRSHRAAGRRVSTPTPSVLAAMNRQQTGDSLPLRTLLSGLLLCLLLAYWWVSRSPLAGVAPLTHEQFESSFGSLRFDFDRFPYFAFLYTRDPSSLSARLVDIPDCIVALRDYGSAIVYPNCAKLLKEYQKFDVSMPSVLLVYRCFHGESLFNYDLHNATLGDLGFENGQSVIYFTPMPADNCKLYWMEEGLNHKSRYHSYPEDAKGESLFDSDTEPLTAAAYEDEFRRKDVLVNYPYFTFIFVRNQRANKKKYWTHIPECPVALRGDGKARVLPQCAKLLREYRGLDNRLTNLMLPYRCYRSANLNDYELVMVNLDDTVMGDEGDTSITYTPSHDAARCQPIWKEERAPIELALNKLKERGQRDSPEGGSTTLITRQEFEETFHQSGLSMFTNPYISYIYQAQNETRKGIRVEKLVPQCSLALALSGRGLIDVNCALKLRAIQKNDLSNLLVVYRCFKKNENAFDFELHAVPMDLLVKERGFWIVLFTPKPTEHCAPLWMVDENIESILRDPTDSPFWRGTYAEDAEPLTAEAYEAAWLPDRAQSFRENRHQTMLFTRDMQTFDRTLVPLKYCSVSVFEPGRATIDAFCADALKVYNRIDKEMRHLVLPYRCFFRENPSEYELHTVSIEGLEKYSGTVQDVISFTSKTSYTCTPEWRPIDGESLAKAPDPRDAEDDWQIAKLLAMSQLRQQ